MKHRFARALLVPAAVAVAIALAGCNTSDLPMSGRAMAPLSQQMLSEFQEKQMDKGSPILVRLFKEESEFEVWKQNRGGQFALLKTYPICRWSGDLGPKKKEGDRQAPEGFYSITPGQMNPNSSYYLAFNTGYPNAYDRSHGYSGSQLMVHGDCSSRGCYAMTDEQIQEIYALARESFFGGQKAFQLQAFPFRMTALNMARHRNNPNFEFWKMLKEGYDHFDVTHQEPRIAVCEKHYVFDAAEPDNASKSLSFNASGQCPIYQLDKTIAAAVLDHQRSDQFRTAQYIAERVPTVPLHREVDGGMNPIFLTRLETQSAYDRNGRIIQIATAPGSLVREPNSAVVLVASKPRPESAPVNPIPNPEQRPAPAQKPTSIAGILDNLFGGPDGQTSHSSQVAVNASERPRKTGTQPAQGPMHPTASVIAAAHVKPRKTLSPKEVAHDTPSELSLTLARQRTAKDAAPPIRTAFSSTPPGDGNGLLNGAQPVVPAGSFNSRWGGLQ